jgi:hypothetical protein
MCRTTSACRAGAPWAQEDVADSAYRVARELFNLREYGGRRARLSRAAQKYPNSAYAPEAAYYQRSRCSGLAGTSDLREALRCARGIQGEIPNARSRTEATNLTTRIQGVLAQRR